MNVLDMGLLITRLQLQRHKLIQYTCMLTAWTHYSSFTSIGSTCAFQQTHHILTATAFDSNDYKSKLN